MKQNLLMILLMFVLCPISFADGGRDTIIRIANFFISAIYFSAYFTIPGALILIYCIATGKMIFPDGSTQCSCRKMYKL